MITKKCLKCGEEFSVHKCRETKAQYCSNKCRYEHKTGRTLKKCKCAMCGTMFDVERRLMGKYCSEYCYHMSKRRRINKTCFNCGKEFEIKRTTTMNCCSMKCRLEYQQKNKKPRIYQKADPYYHTKEWKRARMRALVRDDFKCVKCGIDTFKLHVHHIISLKCGGSDELDNIISVCHKCHASYHKKNKDKGKTYE